MDVAGAPISASLAEESRARDAIAQLISHQWSGQHVGIGLDFNGRVR